MDKATKQRCPCVESIEAVGRDSLEFKATAIEYTMKVYYSTLLALMIAEQAACFVPSQRWLAVQRKPLPATLSMVEPTTDSDVSIPYDAAARLAYDEWRDQFNKGKFDPARFDSFKTNYETITVANVVAKKKAREDGTVSLSLMALNEFGDLSENEYKQAMEPAVTTTGDVLGKAVEAAELQNEASNALGEAADALAEEEQVRTGIIAFSINELKHL